MGAGVAGQRRPWLTLESSATWLEKQQSLSTAGLNLVVQAAFETTFAGQRVPRPPQAGGAVGADRRVGPLTEGAPAGGSGSLLDPVLLPFPAHCVESWKPAALCITVHPFLSR